MPVQQTHGWCSVKGLTNQCAACNWILVQHGMACCEFDRPCFPAAMHCDHFEEVPGDNQ
jgi:hypothetical protein